jgi:hypothetical protein
MESELSLEDDLSVSGTLEETIAVFNKQYDLKLNVGIAKNLIYLSKQTIDKKLEKDILENTKLFEDMKKFKHYVYS